MTTSIEPSNGSPVDEWSCNVLKNASVPPEPASYGEWFTQALLKPKRRAPWVLPSGFAVAVGSLALVAAFLLMRPTPSVASPTLRQVDQAQLAVKSMTVTHRITTGGSEIYVVVMRRDGDRWTTTYGPTSGAPYFQTIMDGHETTTIHRMGKLKQVLIDGPSKYPEKVWVLPTPENFLKTPSEIFGKWPGSISVKRGVLWRGKTVDQFEVVMKTLPKDKFTMTHVLFTDPTTHLPLQLETRGSDPKTFLGEVFTYDYSPVPESAFIPKIPAGAKVTDIRRERQAVHRALTKDGLVVFDDIRSIGVFLPDQPEILRAAKAHTVRVKIEGGPASYTWPQLVSISQHGEPSINSPWRQMVIYAEPPVVDLRLLAKKKTVSVLVNGKPFTMPVMRIANTQAEFEFVGQHL